MDSDNLMDHLLGGGDVVPGLARCHMWVVACEALLARGHIAFVTSILPGLVAAFPKSAYLASMNRLLPLIPEVSRLHTPFSDQDQAIQVVPCRGSHTVLLCFCGVGDRLGFSLNLVHRWLSYIPAHIVYLKGFWPVEVTRDKPYAGADPEAALATLNRIVADLGATRILCWGNSIGVYGALKFGHDLGADAILGFGGKTTLEDGLTSGAPSYKRADLRPLYMSGGPRTCLVYAANNVTDTYQAENFAGLPGVVLCPVADSDGHNVISEVISVGLLPRFIDWLTEPQYEVNFA